MLNSLDRATLKGLAMKMQPTTQIGKNGISETLITQIDEQLNAREIVKISVLKNAEVPAKVFADEIAKKLKAEVVQTIGSKIVLYRFSMKDNIVHAL